ncbi:hypothetical protein EVAR_57843_1 [Eumeta japonica]|uniref:Uncharacterized protein n=1 Tax=Eumeta variegata TaxID=151549 RepID=A0A4C1YRT8_EUMVA|nr:hypothetical protein EVAR_57843_1 [Eumeta japonica]
MWFDYGKIVQGPVVQFFDTHNTQPDFGHMCRVRPLFSPLCQEEAASRGSALNEGRPLGGKERDSACFKRDTG